METSMTMQDMKKLTNLYVERAEIFYELKEYDKCKEDLTKSISLNGAFNPNVFFLLAISHRISGNFELALEIINNLIIILENPLPKYFIERGITYYKLEEYHLAIMDFLQGSIQLMNKPEATRMLALCYEKLGDIDETMKNMILAAKQGDIVAQEYMQKHLIYGDNEDNVFSYQQDKIDLPN
jgi:lipoprotein NlpI